MDGQPEALFNVHGSYDAINNTCPHEDGPCGRARFAAASSAAPVHAHEFDVSSGNCLTESAYCVERFEVHVEGDDILVSEEPAPG